MNTPAGIRRSSFMDMPSSKRPSLVPSAPLPERMTSRVETSVPPPAGYRGWNSRGYLPHWDHPGMIQTVNFRLADALPASVLDRWQEEFSRMKADDAAIAIYRRAEKYLDAGHGGCWLRNSEIAQVVENALLHFDGERYRLLAWCVMPNHVHAMIETLEGFPLADVLHSWKSFTAKAANKILGRQGEFWQRDYFDRYIRHAEHFQQAIAYIEENPVKAGLAQMKTGWPWSSARVRAAGNNATGSAGILPAS